ncbi:hypothetical protein PNU17_12270 [Turicibacter sanguinis]|uniref:hypothetical protein n=1 Tax=Turicibacter sanguinis TaxID=154288 RepID=UPI00189B2686|nr:hypothetical protein [Turicibacter sanguinis]MDB8556543.1 hypothetical protein [Turicibacter sanguinis]
MFRLIDIEEDEEGVNCLSTYETEVQKYTRDYVVRIDIDLDNLKIYIVNCEEYEIIKLKKLGKSGNF